MPLFTIPYLHFPLFTISRVSHFPDESLPGFLVKTSLRKRMGEVPLYLMHCIQRVLQSVYEDFSYTSILSEI